MKDSVRGVGGRARRSLRALVAVFTVAALVPLVLVFGSMSAGAATATITSPGPLTAVGISDQLNCSVNHIGDAAGEFYNGTACGTFVVVDGTMYFSPAVIPAGQPSTTPFTPVSQVGPTGTGTEADPFTIVTVVGLGETGLTLTQTDTYTTGLESYRTDIALQNSSGTAKTTRVYRAADCYLQSSDVGYGAVDTSTGAVACTTGLEEGSRIEQWFPLTPGSSYLESNFATVWSTIAARNPFPNTCTCTSLTDNGAGLSWDRTLAAGGSTTISSLITFSPLGRLPLSLAKSADAGSVAPGGTTGYTITADNPNGSAVPIDITDSLPAGFAYVPGSTTGATTANPTIVGQDLTWPGISTPAGATATLHFSATATSTPGTYTNEATATAEGYTVAPTGPTAPVTVTDVANPVVLALTPATATNPVNTSHTVTATATIDSVPQPGLPVSFEVISGPNAGLTGEGTTNSAGEATFSYSSEVVGTDTIQASTTADESTVNSNTVTKTWESVLSPLALALTPATATNPVNTSHTVTATATRGAVAQSGVPVSFSIISGPNAGLTGSSTTNGSGAATFSYSSEVAGTDTIQASAVDGEATVDSNTVTKTWTPVSAANLSITSTTAPAIVTTGGSALTTVTARNTGTGPANGVTVTVTIPAGTTLTSITPSQGTCGPLAAGSVTCSLGTINGGGATATVKAQVTVPGAVPPGGRITIGATATSATTGPVAPASSSTAVVAPAPGVAFGYVPPGGSISTGTTATPTNNTVINFTLPNNGPGVPMILAAENDPTNAFCGGQRCSGKTAFLAPFTGYNNPNSPAKLKITWDRTVAGRGIWSSIYVQKAPGGRIVTVPECQARPRYDRNHHQIPGWWSWFGWWWQHRFDRLGPHSGIANPAPCVDARSVDRNGDVTFEILLLSGDPKFARR